MTDTSTGPFSQTCMWGLAFCDVLKYLTNIIFGSAFCKYKPGLPVCRSGEQLTCQSRRRSFHPRVGKISWEGVVTHSSILACEIPRAEETGKLQSRQCKSVNTTSQVNTNNKITPASLANHFCSPTCPGCWPTPGFSSLLLTFHLFGENDCCIWAFSLSSRHQNAHLWRNRFQSLNDYSALGRWGLQRQLR